MPRFDVLSVDEAMMKTATGKRAQITREYLEYLGELGRGKAGHLKAEFGENIAAIRRRLGVAAKLAKKDLVVKRGGDEIYFWIRGSETMRRGRPRKNPL